MANFKEYLDGKSIPYAVDANGDITVNGGLDLINADIKELPDNLIVNGSLYISYTDIKELPDTLKVNGNLNISNTKIAKLPDSLTVNRNLYLSNTDIKELPDNLTVGGGLYIRNTNIKELPNNLTVNGGLYLRNADIKELPDSLIVRGFLDIRNTKITKLPDTLNCDLLYLDHKNITNIVYRENCGIEKRTIFAINTANGIMVSAGVYLGTLAEFEIAVDLIHAIKDAKAYKNKARECVAELTTMLTAK